MKKKYLPPTIHVHIINTPVYLLAGSSATFSGNRETPQDLDILNDEIGNEDDIG